MNVIHGDLKGDNILVNHNGSACLCDFGLASIKVAAGTVRSTRVGRGTVHFMAPELFGDENDDVDEKPPIPTASSDVYALSIVFIEIFTGEVPYARAIEAQVIYRTITGFRPKRPENSVKLGLSDEVWEILQKCWDHDPSERPEAHLVLDWLSQAALENSG